jgi:beta-1,4-mannosyl-glycoprotein beta-1,4-N-acetylglucosaminyltransferase
MIYDCFIIRDELDLLELRLQILDKVVDKFVICEANKTHTNKLKPYFFIENVSRFEKWMDKIIYLPIELDDTGLDFSVKDITYNPVTAAWQFEYQQRNALIYGLENINDDDIILMGDLDEIPNPKDISNIIQPSIFIMDFFYYFVNNKSVGYRDNQWLGTIAIKGIYLKQFPNIQNLRDIRNTFAPIKSGWHISYLGGKEMIKTKIQTISHTENDREEYYSDENIELCLHTGKDIFGREGMEFTLYPLNQLYPQDILEIILQYPQFIYKN